MGGWEWPGANENLITSAAAIPRPVNVTVATALLTTEFSQPSTDFLYSYRHAHVAIN